MIPKQRQTVQASPLQTTASSGTDYDVTLTISEPGQLHLADLLLQTYNDDIALGGTGVSIVQANPLSLVNVVQKKVNAAVYIVQGRNTPNLPATMFSPLRAFNLIGFPTVPVDTGDKVVITCGYTRTNAVTLNTSACIPFTPDRLIGVLDEGVMPGTDEVAAGAPDTALTADGTDATVTCTFARRGLVDLGRIAVGAAATLGFDANADGFTEQSCDDVPVSILSMVLRSEGNLIGGSGTVSAPNLFAYPRAKKWANFGVRMVSPGDTLVLTIESDTDALLNGHIYTALPQYAPGIGARKGGRKLLKR